MQESLFWTSWDYNLGIKGGRKQCWTQLETDISPEPCSSFIRSFIHSSNMPEFVHSTVLRIQKWSDVIPSLRSVPSNRRDRGISTGLHHSEKYCTKCWGLQERDWLHLAECSKVPEKGVICQSSKKEQEFTRWRREREGKGLREEKRRRREGREGEGRVREKEHSISERSQEKISQLF